MNEMDTEAARIRAVVAEWMAGCATRKPIPANWHEEHAQVSSRRPSDLERVYLLWKQRSTPRWAAQLGDDAGDLLAEVWLKLQKVSADFEYTGDQAAMRYIETVAGFCLRDKGRTEARRAELMNTALELGARGLTQKSDINQFIRPVEPAVDMDMIIGASGLTRQQRIVIVGLRRGVDRDTLAEMLEVTMETVREYERAGIARIREAVKK